MNKKFEFKYSAPTQEEREEIKYIQEQYKEKTKKITKLEYLRKLDNKVKGTPACIALSLGVLGLLIFGMGLTMILEWGFVVWGIVVGIIGCVPMGFAYFSYNRIEKKLKEKYSAEILKISGELLNEDSKEL